MNDLHPANTSNRPLFAHFKFADFEVSWAGPNPFRTGFCFGSEDGRLLFTDETGNALYDANGSRGSFSGEAITGMARAGRYLAVTTRAEVNFWTGPEEGDMALVVFPHGAHQILATAAGAFAAPLGRTGIMAIQPPFQESRPATVIGGEKEGLNFYRLASLRSSSGEELLACAARSCGVGVTKFRWDREAHQLNTIWAAEQDVVDVCALGPGTDSLALAAVGRDGTLILFQDVWHDPKPTTIKFDAIEGTAYRLLNSRGHLFLLTSKGMYVLGQLAAKFAAGEPIGNRPTPVLTLPMEAVDANLCGDRWLLIVLPDEVLRVDIDLIHQNTPVAIANGEVQQLFPQVISPDWKQQGVEQVTRQVTANVA